MRVYFAIILFSVCSCNSKVDYPLKGDKYPSSLSALDSTNYIFPLKDALPKKDSFEHTNFYRCVLTKFNEPNLRIGPQQQPVYRILYGSNMDKSLLVTLRPHQIVVKEQTKGYRQRFLKYLFFLQCCIDRRFPQSIQCCHT